MTFFTNDDQKVVLSEDAFLKSGGEGRIYQLNSKVVKLYSSIPHSTTEQKVCRLLSKKLKIEGLCLPEKLLYDEEKRFRGYLMSLAPGKQMKTSVFGKNRLEKYFPKWTRIDLCDLALTFLRKVEQLHRKDILIGDINPTNIHVVSPREIYLIDTDSYQVDEFPCPVGTDYFTAPELQNISFKNHLRQKEHEYYAIATLVFMIFFPGKSPYAKIGGNSPTSNIEKGEFSYPFGNNANYKAPKGPWEYIWKDLTYELKKTFYLTFVDKNHRFSPKQWIRQVRRYKRHLEEFPNSKKEIFPKVMEKVRDNVSTKMRSNVRSKTTVQQKIETKLNIDNTESKIGVLELSTKAVKLLIGDDNAIKTRGFDFRFFPIRSGIRTNTGDYLDGANTMDLNQFTKNVLPSIRLLLKEAKKQDVTRLYTVATAAYRASVNRNEIIKIIKRATGVNVKILSKKEEALQTLIAFSFSKPLNVTNIPENTIMIDQGGGSTEVTLFNNTSIKTTHSISLGTTILTNILLSQNNPDTSINAALIYTDKTTKGELNNYFKKYAPEANAGALCLGVGTAITKGTGKRTNRDQHGYQFTQASLVKRIYFYEEILKKQYKNIEALNQGIIKQEKILGSLDTRNILSIRLGLPLYLEILKHFEVEEITVSSTGLWYGIYFDNLFK